MCFHFLGSQIKPARIRMALFKIALNLNVSQSKMQILLRHSDAPEIAEHI